MVKNYSHSSKDSLFLPSQPVQPKDNISVDYQDSRTGQDQKFSIRDHNYKDDNLFVGFLFLPVAVIVLP